MVDVKSRITFWNNSTFRYDLLDEVKKSRKQGQQDVSSLLYTSTPSIEHFYRQSSLDSKITMLKGFQPAALYCVQVGLKAAK